MAEVTELPRRAVPEGRAHGVVGGQASSGADTPAPSLEPGTANLSLYAVELTCDAALVAPVTLTAVKADPRLADFALTRVPRLSVMPVTDAQWTMLTAMAHG